MHKIPVYLLNGALGSGKTTLLRELLQKHAQKQFVIENEIANTSVDDEVLQNDGPHSDIHTIAGECVCCSDGSSLMKALTAAREGEYEAVFIESSGAASMAKLLINLLGEAYFTDNFEIRHTIYVLDALSYQRRAPSEQDIVVADSVVVSKLDLAKDAKSVKQIIKKDIAKPLYFKDETMDISTILHAHSSAVQSLRDIIRDGLSKELHHPATIVLENNKVVDIETLTKKIKHLGVERAKGFLQTLTGTVRYEATTDHFEVTEYEGEIKKHYLVLIDSDKQKIDSAYDTLKE